MAQKQTRKTATKRTTTGRGRGGSGGGGGQQIGLLLSTEQKKDLRNHISNSEKLMKLWPEYQAGHQKFLILASNLGIEPRAGRGGAKRTGRRTGTTARTGNARQQNQTTAASA